MPATLKIRTFGGLDITLDGQPLPAFPTRKVEALLVYLAFAGRPCPREVVANLLWDERSQAQSLANLRAALSRLRQRLPEHLEINRYHLALRREGLWLDASALAEAWAAVHAAAPTESSVRRLEEALRLYQGDFLEGFALRDGRGFDDWLLLEREQSRRQALEALAWLAGWQADHGRYAEALLHTRRRVVLDPLDEAGHRQLMRLQALTGDRSQALAQYADVVRRLETELGAPPAAETEVLYQQIRSGQLGPPEPVGPARKPQAREAAASPETAPGLVPLINPLPQEVYSRYIGQAKRQAQIREAIAERARLITIYGRAGVGKTALACKVIGDIRRQPLAPGYPGSGLTGIVSLSGRDDSLRLERVLSDVGRLLGADAQRVLQAVAHNPALPAEQKVAVLLEQLQGRRVLLLLDNLETLQDATTGQLLDPDLRMFIETVLAASSDLCLLVTSREPLALPRPLMTWEHSVALDDGLPPEEATALLKAFDAGGQARLREATPDLLRRLAERVHGFPRALEAMAGLLLEDPLLRPEDLLAGGPLFEQEVTAKVVQQAIERLSPEGQRVLEALAIFGQPVPLAAVEYALAPYWPSPAPASRALVARLVRTFFVRYDGETRNLHLHPLDQAYCYERIPDDGAPGAAYTRRALHGRAAEYHARQRPPRETWRTLENLAQPLTEFRHWVAAGAYDRAAEVLLAIDRDHLWEWGQYQRLAEMYRQLEGRLSDRRLAQACRRRQAWMAWPDALAMAASFEQNLAEARQAGDQAAAAGALDDLAQNARFRGDYARARDLHAQALALFRQAGDARGEAEALGGLGQCYALFGDYRQAISVTEQALAIYRELGLGANAGFALWSLGMGHFNLGELDRAKACMAASLEAYEAANSAIGALPPQAMLGLLYAMQGRLEDAFSLLEATLDLARRIHAFLGVIMTSISLGYAQLMAGDAAGAAAQLQPLLERAVQAHNYAGEALIGHFLSMALVLLGEIEAAQVVSAALRPANSPRQAAMQAGVAGIIEFRLGHRPAALARFREVIRLWQAAVTDDDQSDWLYWRALALAGLARLNNGSEQAADAAYAEAERRLPALGLRELHRQLLRALLA